MILNFILCQSFNSKRALTLFGEIHKERVRECGVDLLLMQAAGDSDEHDLERDAAKEIDKSPNQNRWPRARVRRVSCVVAS